MIESAAQRMHHPWVDETDAPIYVLRFPSEASDDELEIYYRALEAFYRGLDHPIGWVVELGNVLKQTASQRRIVSEQVTKLAVYERKWVCGMGIVANSAVTRGIITAVFWVSKPGCPYQVFKDSHPARLWVQQRFGAPLTVSQPVP